ncbi:MAG: energy transducer TonB [Leptolyngbyaceae cyanobacterium SM1_3_5]|nr:energy transducer TonB [Leptolyngbyaceae cyanobacterium SM1_3_5]
MGFSEEADQQRRREAKALRRFVGISLAGSLLTHGLIVALPVRETARPPRKIEIAVVPPRPSPSPPAVPPVDRLIEPRPREPRPREPERVQRPTEPRPPIPEAIASPATTLPPEGSPDATVNESPLVGSGLAPGTGGFSEGIGLNQSDSPIRGEGGGDRQGVPDGVPGGSIAPSPEPQAIAPAPPSASPVVVDRPPPVDPALLQVVCRRCPEPDYPRSALQAGIEGRVRVTVDVDRRGRVTGVRLVQPSGDRALDAAVLATVQERWRFEEIEGGASNVPVEVYMTVSDSELNQRAQEWGDRTAVRVPSSGFAAPTPQAPAAARPTPTPSREEIDRGLNRGT